LGNDLKLTITDTGDSVTVKDWLVNDTPVHGIELITFTDGTVWDTAAIQNMLVKGTDAPDEIIGFSGADFIEGFGSDDTLYGRGGDDTIVSGNGSDALFGQDGNDALVAGDNDDTLVGGSGNDFLDPGTGNDLLFGGDTLRWSGSLQSNGNDVYFFDNGYAHDTVLDHDRSTGNTDTILLGEGITPDDVSLNRDGEDLVLSLNVGADTLTVQQWFWNDSPEYRVEVIQFADGTTWDVDAIKERVLRATDGDDVLIGTSVSDTLSGYGGNDRIFGRGSEDVLDGGSGGNTYKKRAAGLLWIHRTLCCGRMSQPRPKLTQPHPSHKVRRTLALSKDSKKLKKKVLTRPPGLCNVKHPAGKQPDQLSFSSASLS
jgi:Ca2+-binding RTX toxin-like protein